MDMYMVQVCLIMFVLGTLKLHDILMQTKLLSVHLLAQIVLHKVNNQLFYGVTYCSMALKLTLHIELLDGAMKAKQMSGITKPKRMPH